MVTGTMTNRHILIDESIFPSSDPIWVFAQNGGGDLRFTSDLQGNTQVGLEIISFDTVAKTCILWTTSASVSAIVDTPLYLFYGEAGVSQPAASATGGSESVWPTADYKAVYHMNTINDSSNQFNGTSFDGSFVAGQVGNCMEFNGSSEEFDLPDLAEGAESAYTLEVWTNIDVKDGSDDTIFAIDNDPANNYTMRWDGGNADYTMVMNSNTPAGYQDPNANPTIGVWQLNAWAYSVSSALTRFYKNNTMTTGTYSTANTVTYGQSSFGARFTGGAFNQFWNGKLDEGIISRVQRDNPWVFWSYENQFSVSATIKQETFVF